MSGDLTPIGGLPIPRQTTAVSRDWICSMCHGSALVFAVRTGHWVDQAGGGREWQEIQEHDRTTPVVFRCQCYRGKTDRRNYPIWDRAYEKEFRVPR